MQQPGPHIDRLLSQVDQVFFEQTLDTMEHAINTSNAPICHGSLNGPNQAGIDNGGGSARLSNNEIAAY